MCTRRFYYSSSKFSKFIQGKSPLLQQLASVSLLKEKSKICPKLIELLSWNDPTVHVCCFMLAGASTKNIRQPKPYSLAESKKNSEKFFVSRKIRQQGHSLAEVSLYLQYLLHVTRLGEIRPASSARNAVGQVHSCAVTATLHVRAQILAGIFHLFLSISVNFYLRSCSSNLLCDCELCAKRPNESQFYLIMPK